MFLHHARLAFGVALAASIWPVAAAAQATSAEELMQLGTGALRDEVTRRYDAALAASQDPGVISADSNRYMWASQAKAQCGIAIGFLKSGTKDPVSVGKCADAHDRMQGMVSAPLPSPPQLGVAPADCSQSVAGIVFFDWDSAMLPESAAQTIDGVVSSMSGCRWSGLQVTGHTDRSGSDAYNVGLSARRANAVADVLESRGISRGQLEVSGRGESEPKVPTIDGERNPTNRRVEITVN